MSDRQFVAVAFSEGGRAYTYHNDGEPVTIGDVVLVPVRGDARQAAHVVSLPAEPPFETKPIVGKHTPAEEEK